jgi:predicted O-methyltransferase YrrM
MIIDYKKIQQTNTDFYQKYYVFDDTHHFALSTGEHYKLLTYISFLYNDITILDIGTADGASCLALAQNKNNKVISYDINNITLPFANDYTNVEFKNLDINHENVDIIKSAKIILLDAKHDGIMEKTFADILDSINYEGYVICDDVYSSVHPENTEWFDSVTIEKYNLTEIGHSHGTGLLNYYKNNNVKIIK